MPHPKTQQPPDIPHPVISKPIGWSEKQKVWVLGTAFVVVCTVVGGIVGAVEDLKRPVPSSPAAVHPASPGASRTTVASLPTPVQLAKAGKPGQTSFRHLKIGYATRVGNRARITGKTDFPDGTKVHVSFSPAHRNPKDTYIGSDAEATAKAGVFSIDLPIPERPEFKSGSYEVSALITPRAQDANVLARVGANGERIVGGTRVGNMFNVMETKLVVHGKFAPAVAAGAFSIPAQSSFPEGSPGRCFASFLWLWKQRDWQGMSTIAQPTWKTSLADPVGNLKGYFPTTLLGADNVKIGAGGGSMVECTADIREGLGSTVKNTRIRVNIIREQGRWTFNPLSAIRRDQR